MKTGSMNRTLLIAPLVVFGLAGLVLYWTFMRGGSGPFHENLLPELIGFCLEGFFLVGLFSLIQGTREHERRKEMWLSLRSALREFLSHIDMAFLEQDAEPTASVALETDPRVVVKLAETFKRIELDLDSMVALKETGARELELSHDLIPVAAQLSAAHMRWWIAIVDSIRLLSDATDQHQIEVAIRRFLANLQEFDSLRY